MAKDQPKIPYAWITRRGNGVTRPNIEESKYDGRRMRAFRPTGIQGIK